MLGTLSPSPSPSFPSSPRSSNVFHPPFHAFPYLTSCLHFVPLSSASRSEHLLTRLVFPVCAYSCSCKPFLYCLSWLPCTVCQSATASKLFECKRQSAKTQEPRGHDMVSASLFAACKPAKYRARRFRCLAPGWDETENPTAVPRLVDPDVDADPPD